MKDTSKSAIAKNITTHYTDITRRTNVNTLSGDIDHIDDDDNSLYVGPSNNPEDNIRVGDDPYHGEPAWEIEPDNGVTPVDDQIGGKKNRKYK